MGRLVVHCGPSAAGQTVKVVSNAVTATNAAVLAQALLVGRRARLDLDALVEVMGAGSAASTMVTLKAGPMLAHDYTPLFKLDHMLKDVTLALGVAAEAGAPVRLRRRDARAVRRGRRPGVRRRRFRGGARGARGAGRATRL